MIKATRNNVILQKKVEQGQKGIYMPNMGDDSYIVLDIGVDVLSIQVGNEVVLDKSPKLFKFKMQDYYITNVDNIIAIVEVDYE